MRDAKKHNQQTVTTEGRCFSPILVTSTTQRLRHSFVFPSVTQRRKMYAQFVQNPNFNPAADAETLHYAMMGKGCDEKKCVFLGSRNPVELELIKQAYIQKFSKDLVNELDKELKGHFRMIVLDLFKDPLSFDADSVHRAMKGAGSDGDALIEILVTKSNAQKQLLKTAYQTRHGGALETRIAAETSGNFKDFLLNLLVPRDENPQVVDNNAREDSIAL